MNYEIYTYVDINHKNITGSVTGSSYTSTKVTAKTFGQHNAFVKVGADLYYSKNLMFN